MLCLDCKESQQAGITVFHLRTERSFLWTMGTEYSIIGCERYSFCSLEQGDSDALREG